VDVGGLGLSGAALQLALDVHHRRLPAVLWAFIWWKLADDRPARPSG
jgi:hypothetical protein